jgi:hypothetical protein
MTRSVQRWPSRSRAAIIGRPVRDPRTGVPGRGVFALLITNHYCSGSENEAI